MAEKLYERTTIDRNKSVFDKDISLNFLPNLAQDLAVAFIGYDPRKTRFDVFS